MDTKKPIVVAVSGGFDPVHPGHVRLFAHAKRLGDKLVVILNNDHWLIKKKRFVFMNEKERKEVLLGMRDVDEVVITRHGKNPEDMSVAEALLRIRPDIFANGGDRVRSNVPEIEVCRRLNCKMVFNVGEGGKIQSSSGLVDTAIKAAPRKIAVSIKKRR